MSDEMVDKKITQGQADRMAAPLELDLWAAFRVMEEDMVKMASGYEGTPEDFIRDVTGLLLPGGQVGRVEKRMNKNELKKEIASEVLKLCVSHIRKGRALPPGTKRQRKGGIYVKQSDGTWAKVTDKKDKQEIKKPEVTPINNPDVQGYGSRPSTFESEAAKKLSSKISESLGIEENNIYIHSSNIDGLQELIDGENSGDTLEDEGKYLSTSTLNGSVKFIDKTGTDTLYMILDAKPRDLDFYSYGDVGEKGMSPTKTTYDEAGLTSWKISGAVIPPGMEKNEKVIGSALLARDIMWGEHGMEDFEIIGADPEIESKVETYIEDFWEKNEDDMDKWEIREALRERFS